MSTLQLLLIVAFLLIGIRKAYKKSKVEQVDNPNQKPMEEEDYGKKNKNREKEQETPIYPKFRSTTALHTDSIKSPPLLANTDVTMSSPLQTLSDDVAESEEDFSISSPEDAVRAIVWSEILHRKY
jgi:hypothetical protein